MTPALWTYLNGLLFHGGDSSEDKNPQETLKFLLHPLLFFALKIIFEDRRSVVVSDAADSRGQS